jgi:GTP-binding protein
MGSQRNGRCGEDCVAKVPLGTVVTDAETGDFVGELLTDGDELVVAKGGRGGIGNIHFKSSTNQSPHQFTEGKPGEECNLWLELKLVADIGLVGYPNAGKSTLLSRLTHAHPKIAPYPFTTINPIIGTMEYANFNRLRIADIPGLIDGAHEGVGLGHQFLRHIERSHFLLFVIDMAGTDDRNPSDDFLHLREELRLHREELASTPYMVVANKMDSPGSDVLLKEFQARTKEKVYPISAELGEGLEPVREHLYNHFFDSSRAQGLDD